MTSVMSERRTVLTVVWGLAIALVMIQAALWMALGGPGGVIGLLAVTVPAIALALAAIASSRLNRLFGQREGQEQARRGTLAELEELHTQNAILDIVSRSADVMLAFQALARRIAGMVPCDRVGLALLSADGTEFQTYTARPEHDQRRTRPRPEVVFKTERSVLGAVVRSGEPLLIGDTSAHEGDFLDVNVLKSAGFASALVIPLVTRGRAVGTLNVVSRQRHAFDERHISLLVPIAELFAVTSVAQQLELATGKYQTMEAMSEVTLAVAAEVNSALQSIIGHCDLIERAHDNPDLHRDLATIVGQAQRIEDLLAKMRAAAQDRLKAAATGAVPLAPPRRSGQQPSP